MLFCSKWVFYPAKNVRTLLVEHSISSPNIRAILAESSMARQKLYFGHV
jgi:hypothetical protein